MEQQVIMETNYQLDSLSVSNEPASLAQIRSFVRHACYKASLGQTDSEEVLIAVGEACNNSIRYGRQSGFNQIVITYALKSEHIAFTIAGKSVSFNPEKLIHVKQELQNKERLGTLLMRKLVDQVIFDLNEDGARVCLIKNRKPKN
jgi:anti-sigma regulatory factor (Ser/Thr protein kinase)